MLKEIKRMKLDSTPENVRFTQMLEHIKISTSSEVVLKLVSKTWKELQSMSVFIYLTSSILKYNSQTLKKKTIGCGQSQFDFLDRTNLLHVL